MSSTLTLGRATRANTVSPVLATVGHALRRAGLAVWHALEALGEARAEREMARLADSVEASNPALAARLRRGCRNNWL